MVTQLSAWRGSSVRLWMRKNNSSFKYMLVIVDYGLGNLLSVAKAFESIGVSVCVSADPKELKEASHIVLPGVGAFPRGMQNLKSEGLRETLEEEVMGNKKPFLGICL